MNRNFIGFYNTFQSQHNIIAPHLQQTDAKYTSAVKLLMLAATLFSVFASRSN